MAGLTTDRDLNDLIEESIAEGFTIERMANNHLKWTPPNYPEAFFTSASTPKSRRIVEHVRLQKRRALAGYSERLPHEMQQAALDRMAKQNQERKDAAATLKGNPFRKLLKPNRPVLTETPMPKRGAMGREEINMFEAARRTKALAMATGRPMDEVARNVAETFIVMTPAGKTTGAQSIINIINRKRTPKMVVLDPDPNAELLSKIRHTLKLPLDKPSKTAIIMGLLDTSLS